MASRIQGITVEIGGDTVGLQNALKEVNNRSKALTNELKDVDRLLKFNPNSTELLAQKQQLLTQQVAETTTKLDQLRAAEQQVQAQFERGDIGEEQYRGFRRELAQTEQALQGYQQAITDMNSEQDRVQRGTRELSTIFDATGSSVSDYANVIGNRLVTAIQNGTATSRDLEYAFQRIGRQAIGAEGDIDRLRATLSTVDDGNSIGNIRRDMQQLQDEAQQTEEAVDGISDSLKTASAALVAGGGLAGAVTQALDLSSLDTKIRISMEIPEESISTVKEVVRSVEAYGVDGEAALEGVRRQWSLNADATDEANAAIVKSAAGITAAFAGIDLIELVQETNEIAASLGITNEEAIGLTNFLLKAGFPPEQLDTISEYGTQMKLAGFTAAEIQSIFEQGINTKTWNIDNLNDGVKEARLTMSGFGLEIPKALAPSLKMAGMSQEKFKAWGEAVAEGGSKGSKAMSEVATWLDGIEDKTLKNEVATKVFGTKWEDQGDNMIQVFQGVSTAADKTGENVGGMTETMNTLNADPIVQLKTAWAEMKTALEPVLLVIAQVVGAIAGFAAENPILLASIVGIGSAVGILIGAIALLAHAFIAISGAIVSAGGVAAALGVAFAAITGPVAIIVGALVGLGIALVALWQNSETFRDGVTSVFNSIKEVAMNVFAIVSSFVQEKLGQIKSFWDANGSQFLTAVQNVFNGIMTVVNFVMPAVLFLVKMVWTAIQQVITGALNVIMGAMKVFSGLFTGDFGKMWEGIKQIFKGSIDVIIGWMTLTFVGGLRTLLTNLAKLGINLIEGMASGISGLFKGVGSTATNLVKAMVDGVLGFFRNMYSTASSIFGTLRAFSAGVWNSIYQTILGVARNIFSSVKSNFTNIVSSVRSIFGTVKGVISDIWNGVMSFFRGIDLTSIGKNIITGLINGIGSMASAVWEKAKDIADGVGNAIKKALDIHSPSRVTKKLGEHTGQGFANGIAAKKKAAEAAAKKSADAAKKAFSDAMDKAAYQFKMGKIDTSEYVKQLEKIEDKYAKTTAQRQKVNLEIKKVEEKHAKELATARKKEFDEDFKLIKDKAELGKITNEQELKQLQNLASKYTKNSTERIAVEKEIKKVKSTIAKEEEEAIKKKFDKEKALIENKKYYNKLSLLEELAAYENYIKKYKKGSDERIYYEKEIYRVKQDIQSKVDKINEDYLSNVQTLNQNLIDEENKLNEAYQKALDDRTKSLYSFAGIFDEIAEKDVSGDTLLNNLQSQVTAFEEWQKNISELASKGINDGLLAELQEMGPKAGAEIAALNTLTEEQLSQYASLWQEKNRLAKEQAMIELVNMKIETSNKIDELRIDTANKLLAY